MHRRHRTGRPAALGALALLTGCHTYVPVMQAPAPGTDVALVLTDRGRAALGERIGPEVDQLRGTLESASDSSVTLAVTQSLSLRGLSQGWTGERITVSRDQLAGLRVRQLDKGRTALAVLTAGVGVGLLTTFGFAGAGGSGESGGTLPPGPPPGPSTRAATLTHP